LHGSVAADWQFTGVQAILSLLAETCGRFGIPTLTHGVGHWQLESNGHGTSLALRHSVDGDWLFKVAAGWHICLAVLERYRKGNPVGAIVGEEAKLYGWQQLHDRYDQRLQSMKSNMGGQGSEDPIS
jgi:hypothetical protein